MKQKLLSALAVLVLASTVSAQKTIFVKLNAAGANDGTSWTNAYTSLSNALAAAAKGDQVWVAAGAYKQTTGTANASFPVLAGVQLYGGFNGTESTLAARNIAANITILSGDQTGDDIPANYAQKRSDNALHVLEITAGASASDRAVVDGFTVSGGQTKTGAANPDLSRRGAGILANAPLTLRNCRFTDNFAESGSGIAAVAAAASGMQVENCLFEANECSASGAGIFWRDQTAGTASKCIFRNNTTNRGSFYFLTCSGITVDSCLFENNKAGANFTGGMYTWQSNFTVTNSIFRNNTATTAAAMYNDGREGSHFFTLKNCLFENNSATNIGAIDNWQASYLMENCIFKGNKCKAFGQVYNDSREGNDNFTINNCLFEANIADDLDPNTSTFGGALYNWQSSFVLKNTTFRNNTADVAGAMYNDGRLFQSSFVVDSCLFEDNKGVDYGGGAMYNWKADFELKNTTFRNNFAGSVAGAIYNGDSTTYTMQRCLFESNDADFGAGIANFGSGNQGSIVDCDFKSNKANTSGGGMVNGFTADITVQDSRFEANEAQFGGGINNQNDYTRLTLEHSSFSGNTATENGGGVNVGTGMTLTVNECNFQLNTGNYGGAIAMSEDSLDLTKLIVDKSVFFQNYATTQAAAINLSDTEAELRNCLFMTNQNIGSGAGGAISNNGSAGKSSSLMVINCTIADNFATIGGGIAQWEDVNGNSVLTLQNCILYNNTPNNYEVEDGNPEVMSLGGNLSGDGSLTAVLNGTNDLNQQDPKFVDVTSFDYHLQAGSPCIDKGIAANAPAVDLDGNLRSGTPDQGCFEFQVVGTHQPWVAALPLRLSPNPAAEQAILELDNDLSGSMLIEVSGSNGAALIRRGTDKPKGRWTYPLDIQALPAGMYRVQATLGQNVFQGILIKG